LLPLFAGLEAERAPVTADDPPLAGNEAEPPTELGAPLAVALGAAGLAADWL
jgi:hypothetical protein